MPADKNAIPRAAGRKTVGILLRQAPYGSSLVHEALEAVLAFGVYGVRVSLIFIDDGVFQIIRGQDTGGLPQKNLAKQMAGLELYGIDSIFVCGMSLSRRHLTREQLMLQARILNGDELSDLLHSQDQLLSF